MLSICNIGCFIAKIYFLRFSEIFGEKSKIWSEIKNLVKSKKVGEKSKNWSKIKVLVRSKKIGEKSKM